MTEQYMTPWTVVLPKGDAFVYIIDKNDEQVLRLPVANKAKVERIVACVNVCDGIKSSALNAFADFDPAPPVIATTCVTESEGGEL